MTSAAVYIRVSTDDQTEFSPEAQLRAIKQYADKNDMFIDDEYIFRDEGVSGRRADKRPAFQTMIGYAKLTPKPFEVILVHKFDRFARSREDSIVYKSLLRKDYGIKVISITEQLEDDKFSVILEAMLEAMAEYYSLNLGEEVKKGMTEKARRGELQTPAPFGYRMVDGLLTPHPEESIMIQQIFEKYVNEKVSLRTIAKYLNSLGYKTKLGNVFDTRRIEYIIYNPTYVGKMRWNPKRDNRSRYDYDNPDLMIIDGKHQAIVDEKLWEEANRMIRLKKKNIMPKYDPKGEITTHWLRGLLKCGTCGSTLIFGKNNQRNHGYYRCNRYLTGGCKDANGILTHKIEKMVIAKLVDDTKNFPQEEFDKIRVVNHTNEKELESYLKRIEKINTQIDRARDLVLNGIDTQEEYKANKDRLNSQIDELNDKIKTLEDKITKVEVNVFKNTITGILDIINSDASLTEKNSTLKEIISKIVYDKKGKSLTFYYYYIIE